MFRVVNQTNKIQFVRHRRKLAADGLCSEKKSAIKHTILLSAHPNLQAANPRRWGRASYLSHRRSSRHSYQEGALKSVCEGMRKGAVRCVVPACKPGAGRGLPLVGPEPSYRTRVEEHVLSTGRDQIRPVIPGRVARQQGPSLLHRHTQINMQFSDAWAKGDILTLPGRGHFYFALTTGEKTLARRPESE